VMRHQGRQGANPEVYDATKCDRLRQWTAPVRCDDAGNESIRNGSCAEFLGSTYALHFCGAKSLFGLSRDRPPGRLNAGRVLPVASGRLIARATGRCQFGVHLLVTQRTGVANHRIVAAATAATHHGSRNDPNSSKEEQHSEASAVSTASEESKAASNEASSSGTSCSSKMRQKTGGAARAWFPVVPLHAKDAPERETNNIDR
jgi:hypothetical protein